MSDLKKMYMKMLIPAIPLEVIEVVILVYAILTGHWIPFVVTITVILIYGIIIMNYWYKKVMYICPQCKTTFKPNKMESVWTLHHTMRTRKLTCPDCKKKRWCVEVYYNHNR